MSAVDESAALSLVKARLNRLSADTSLDGYFSQRIAAAVEELTNIGIHLTDSAEDLLLVTDFTVWKYQNRDQPGEMPPWLRLTRRERWIRPEVES